MTPAPLDPLDVAGRVVQQLETGRRETTYKLATIMALVDIWISSTHYSSMQD
ncbi:hypothetical protein [Rhodococcus chondri]|uniref:Uncharacterized protein n=1 Tax=Rhodococcus chondri TaxID=3065941 RepID=A0ABU7JLK2_9NOCA|nr:hypothetical protein [Rhodococcus sp. CC-R104]MEE2030918.1 hypothetical protein [Rhodococcus sp. CC-R104]